MKMPTIKEVNKAVAVLRDYCGSTECKKCPFLHKSYPDYCEPEDYPYNWDIAEEDEGELLEEMEE